jgi:hypothetical protein
MPLPDYQGDLLSIRMGIVANSRDRLIGLCMRAGEVFCSIKLYEHAPTGV